MSTSIYDNIKNMVLEKYGNTDCFCKFESRDFGDMLCIMSIVQQKTHIKLPIFMINNIDVEVKVEIPNINLLSNYETYEDDHTEFRRHYTIIVSYDNRKHYPFQILNLKTIKKVKTICVPIKIDISYENINEWNKTKNSYLNCDCENMCSKCSYYSLKEHLINLDFEKIFKSLDDLKYTNEINKFDMCNFDSEYIEKYITPLNSCVVCYEKTMYELKCDHVLCHNCISKLYNDILNTQNICFKCPYCRRTLDN